MSFKPKFDLVGFIYAPLADVLLQPNGMVRGLVWANDVHFKPGAEIYVDEDLFDTFMYYDGIRIVSWKQVQ